MIARQIAPTELAGSYKCGFLLYWRGDVRLKEWECIQVKSHKDVGKTIVEWQKNGWRLHTYQTAGMGAGPMAYNVNHYLLFERGNNE